MSTIRERARFARDHRRVPGLMSAYLDGELATRARARLERHARECPECRGVLTSLARMVGRLHAVGPIDAGGDVPDIASAVRARLRDSRAD